MAIALLCACAAGADVEINKTNFPDRHLLAAMQQWDLDRDGVLSGQEIARIKNLVLEERGIRSARGIEHLKGLVFLDISDNKITELDVSGFPELLALDCEDNKIMTLNVARCAKLRELRCGNNALTGLELGGCNALRVLECEKNKLTQLNVSDCAALEKLDCDENRLASLQVGGALAELDCAHNNLKELDLSANVALRELDCEDNLLTSLNLENTKVYSAQLDCERNRGAIQVGSARTFDLSTLPGAFDARRASGWQGAGAVGNVLTVEPRAKTVTYRYEVRPGVTRLFSLAVGKAKERPASIQIALPGGEARISLADGPVQLEAVVTPEDAGAVTWKSSKAKIAQIDPSSGLLTPVKTGTVKITASIGKKSKATVKLTIYDPVKEEGVHDPNSRP